MPPQPTSEQALQDGRDRLQPSLCDPNWLILRRRAKIFKEKLGHLPERNLAVLDIGGRLQPYRPLLENRLGRYIAVDPCLTPLVDAAAHAQALPFRDGEFDFVICTQVLQYIADPRAVAAEIRRVLRKGGIAFLSAPAVFPRDHDEEYWRFLPEGLRYILRDFERVEVIPEGNSLTGLIRTLNVFVMAFVRPRFLLPVLAWTVVPVLNLAGSILEPVGGTNDFFTANFSVWVRR